jgi:hydrogenase maturation protease
MPALVISIGNPLRRDDGVAHQVRIPEGIERRTVLQLTPEMAEEIARYDAVIFIDASIGAGVDAEQVRLEPVDTSGSTSPLSHVSSPAQIVALARSLSGFSGKAYTCRLPVSDLSEGEGLSRSASRFAEQAALEIDELMAAAIQPL